MCFPLAIAQVRLHDDHRAADVERARDGLDAPLAHRAEEVRLRFDRRRRGTVGQVQVRADRAERVGERVG